jgi:hypothetical protein
MEKLYIKVFIYFNLNQGTTWYFFKLTFRIGFVGILTGMRYNPENNKGKWSISYNFRKLGDSVYLNALKGLTNSWAIEFLIRNTLENCETYQKAVEIFSNEHTMVFYFINFVKEFWLYNFNWKKK